MDPRFSNQQRKNSISNINWNLQTTRSHTCPIKGPLKSLNTSVVMVRGISGGPLLGPLMRTTIPVIADVFPVWSAVLEGYS